MRRIYKDKIDAQRIYGNMFTRCYRDCYRKHKGDNYQGITICEEWKQDKNNFYEWLNESGEYYTLDSEQVELDKDFKVKGNKVYSPETCIFIPRKINDFITKRNLRITITKGVKGRYSICIYGKRSSYDTREEAIDAYLTRKNEELQKLIRKYRKLRNRIPDNVYAILREYKIYETDIKITDKIKEPKKEKAIE